MHSYHAVVKNVLDHGEWKENRTGISTKTFVGIMFSHDMSQGFPLLTTKRVPFSLVATELEFFIQGKTDKTWLQERKNHIWDEWARPGKAPYDQSDEARQKMLEEKDLGPIYGFQWRHFNAPYVDHLQDYFHDNSEGQQQSQRASCSHKNKESCKSKKNHQKGVDQLKNLVETLKNNPGDRRMLVTAWNPLQIHDMALPPCHYGFQVSVVNGRINLLWNQRSVDVMLGLPFNIASYALLLHLLAKEGNFQEGKLVGFLGDVHIYENHQEGAHLQLSRDLNRYALPHIETPSFEGIFSWKAHDSQPINYKSYPFIPMSVAV